MAYGRFNAGGQSNLRSSDAGQDRANKKDADNSRNITIPKVVLPIKKKKKPVTIFGMTVTAPKTDMQKKIESGKATVIATKSSGKIVTTPTMNNKSLIMSKATQQKTKDEYLSSAERLGNAKEAIGQAISGGQSTRLSQLPSKTGGTPSKSLGLTGAGTLPPKVLTTKLSPIAGEKDGISEIRVSGPVTSGIKSSASSIPTLLRGGNKTKSAGQFTTLNERKFLVQNKSKPTISYAPTVKSLISNISSAVTNTGSWWRNAGDATLKKQKQNNARVKAQIGLSAGKSTF
tara:strand:- start:3689 stop:4552 length:864 start_codon:yes stop_codon:yes gene_type:complete